MLQKNYILNKYGLNFPFIKACWKKVAITGIDAILIYIKLYLQQLFYNFIMLLFIVIMLLLSMVKMILMVNEPLVLSV